MSASNRTPGNAILLNGGSLRATREIGVPNSAAAPTWRSRGYLPHFESSGAVQHVTFHLADSLPQSVLLRFESELKFLPAEKRAIERHKKIDAWIDAGHGSCILRKPEIANMVQYSLLYFDSQRYRLLAWVVMPNHVHALFQPLSAWTVAKIVASWKKFTAREISNYRRNGSDAGGAPVWHREYWDRYIRDLGHHHQAVRYIHMNPVKAGLAASPEKWPWSSASAGSASPPIGEKQTAIQENGVPRELTRNSGG